MKAAELRQCILQAAVQGKLVPQNLGDEPADVLLKRIKQERAQLIRKGKIKKEKPLPLIEGDEIPSKLPTGWVWCRLGELIQLAQNDNIQRNYAANDIINYVDIDAIDNQKYTIREVKQLTVKNLSCRARRILKPGYIVYSLVRPYLDNVALIEDEKENYIGSTGFVVFKPIMINPRYFITVLLSPYIREHFLHLLSGFNSPSISQDNFLATLFPLPPLNMQSKIAEKTNALILLCDKLENLENGLDVLEKRLEEYLPKSILQAAVQGKLVPQNPNDEPANVLLKRIQQEKAQLVRKGKIKKEKPLPPIAKDEVPYELPDGWIWCRLGELCDYGACENAEPSSIPENAWLLELEDIEKNTGIVQERIAKQNRVCKSTKHKFYVGQVLYGKLRPYLNKVLVADDNGYCSSEILPLSYKNIDPYYATMYMRSPIFVEYANTKSYGVKMPRLGTIDGKNALFPIPPVAEQMRIIEKINDLMSLCDELRTVKFLKTLPRASNIVKFPEKITNKNSEIKIGIAARGDINQAFSEKLKNVIDDWDE